MSTSPLVSVIIPNYNHARFLDERMRSVLNQTYQNFEVIILDDKSTDNSLEVISKYKDNPHITQIVVNEENSGSPFRQWRKGIDLSRGELIWIAESDDSCSPLFLEKMVKIHQTTNLAFSFTRSQRMDEEGRLYSTLHNELIGSFNMSGTLFIDLYLGKFNVVTNASSAIFRKVAATSVDKQYEEYHGAGDWMFWIELAQQGSVGFCDEALNYFRQHTNNTTKKHYNDGRNYFEGKKIFDYLIDNNLISRHTALFNKKEHINFIACHEFESEIVRKELFDLWGCGMRYRTVSFISRVINKLDRIIWAFV